MKHVLLRFLPVCLLCFLFSCHLDDGFDRTPMEYRLTAASDVVDAISFTGANGKPALVEATNADGSWSQVIYVVRPFNASVKANFANAGTTDVIYTFEILVKGELYATKTDTVFAQTLKTDELSAQVSQ